MSLRNNALFLTGLLMVSLYGNAEEIKLGNVVATHRITCGKTINIFFADLDYPQSGHTLLGLKNKETGQIDLFLSNLPSSESKPYEKFSRVYFDSLSKNYVKTSYNLSLVWGSARSTAKKEDEFRLAFGPRSYACGKYEILSDEIADKLYGEAT